MKVLILGSQGNLGGQLIKVFSNKYNITALDKNDFNITDQKLVAKKISDIKPEIIINAAAYNAVDKCEDTREYTIACKINGNAIRYLVDAALQVNAIFISYSTDYVFGGRHTEKNKKIVKINNSLIKECYGFDEYDIPCPINKYGETKLMGEREIVKGSGRGLKWYLIRTSKLFGPKGVSAASKPSFFDLMIKLSKERNKINVVDDEISCFTYTVDLANATQQLIQQYKEYGIYHIINSNPCTWYEAARELFKILRNNNITINPVSADKFPRSARRPAYSVLLNTKFVQLRDWKIALQEYLRSIKY